MKLLEHEFARRNARVVLLSCDAREVQQDWARDIMEITREKHLVNTMMNMSEETLQKKVAKGGGLSWFRSSG